MNRPSHTHIYQTHPQLKGNRYSQPYSNKSRALIYLMKFLGKQPNCNPNKHFHICKVFLVCDSYSWTYLYYSIYVWISSTTTTTTTKAIAYNVSVFLLGDAIRSRYISRYFQQARKNFFARVFKLLLYKIERYIYQASAFHWN